MKKFSSSLALMNATSVSALRIVFVLLLILVIPLPALANFEEAEAAFRRGEHSEAYRTCKTEAETGDADCQNLVGIYSKKASAFQRTRQRRSACFRLAAKHGLAIAQCQLGLSYERGLGVLSNETKAARWYQLAAKQGDPIGEYFLALSLARGHGIPKDHPSKAIGLLHHQPNEDICLPKSILGCD